MNKIPWFFWVLVLIFLKECSSVKELTVPVKHERIGMEGLEANCIGTDTIQSFMISKAEAIITFDNERYEATITVYAKRDSILYLSAVNSGYEILRASVMQDSIKVINRLDKIVYTSALQRRFGYQYPVNFRDLQNLVAPHCLCKEISVAHDDMLDHIVFDFDDTHVKKRVHLDRVGLQMKTFEFYHRQTHKFLMGERQDDAIRIYSNFMITNFEILARGGTTTYNRDVKIKMDVNPRRYTFTELR